MAAMHLAFSALAGALPTSWAQWPVGDFVARAGLNSAGPTLTFAPSCPGWVSYAPLETCIGRRQDPNINTSFKVTCGRAGRDQVDVTEFVDVACANEKTSYSLDCAEKCPAFGGPVSYLESTDTEGGGVAPEPAVWFPIGVCFPHEGDLISGVMRSALFSCVEEDKEAHMFSYLGEFCEGRPFAWWNSSYFRYQVRCAPSTKEPQQYVRFKGLVVREQGVDGARSECHREGFGEQYAFPETKVAPASTAWPLMQPASCDVKVDDPEALHFFTETRHYTLEGHRENDCSAAETFIRHSIFHPLDLCQFGWITGCDDQTMLQELFRNGNCTERLLGTRYTTGRCGTCAASTRPQPYVLVKRGSWMGAGPVRCPVETEDLDDNSLHYYPVNTCFARDRKDLREYGSVAQWFVKLSCENATSGVLVVNYADAACQEEHSRSLLPYGCSGQNLWDEGHGGNLWNEGSGVYQVDVRCSKFGKASPTTCPRWEAGDEGDVGASTTPMENVDAGTPQVVGITSSLVGLATTVLWL